MHGMDHSSAQHQQEMASNETLESMLVCNNNNNNKAGEEKKLKPPPEQALKCPRCDSSNTKFCYYNNYSLTQPRYFCKACRRYWTKGGTLRNVPVGGGCRKNRRSSSSSSATSSSSSRLIRAQDLHPSLIQTNPLLAAYDSTDLSLAFARLQNGQLGFEHYQNHDQFSVMGGGNNSNNPNSTHGFLDALRNGYLENPFNGFQNASYYGNNISNAENVGGMNVNVEDQMGNLPYEDLMSSGATTQAVTVTTVKQEGPSGAREAAETGRVLWGYPWQLNGGGDGANTNNTIMGDVDAAGRQSNWITGINGSTNWHGLFNTSLMQGDVN